MKACFRLFLLLLPLGLWACAGGNGATPIIVFGERSLLVGRVLVNGLYSVDAPGYLELIDSAGAACYVPTCVRDGYFMITHVKPGLYRVKYLVMPVRQNRIVATFGPGPAGVPSQVYLEGNYALARRSRVAMEERVFRPDLQEADPTTRFFRIGYPGLYDLGTVEAYLNPNTGWPNPRITVSIRHRPTDAEDLIRKAFVCRNCNWGSMRYYPVDSLFGERKFEIY